MSMVTILFTILPPSFAACSRFDDIRLAEFTIPPLTTVQMSQRELAKIAFQALLNEVESEPLHVSGTNTN